MKPQEAIDSLRKMQSQIIHGSNTFGDIADAMERLMELNAEKFNTIQAYCKAASEDKWQIKKLKEALTDILKYPVHSEPVGGAYAMQDIAQKGMNEVCSVKQGS